MAHAKSALKPELIEDSVYIKPGSVRIVVRSSQHDGKVWQHTHNFYEIVYVESGFSLHGFNGKISVLTTGDLFAIHPGEVHSYISAYHTSIYNVLFYLEELGSLRDEVLALEAFRPRESDSEELPIIRVPLERRRELVELLDSMLLERETLAEGWELRLKGKMIDFLVLYARLFAEGKGDLRHYSSSIYDTLRFIEDNYARELSAAEIASASGLSTDYLARKFRDAMAMTPTEYLRRFRIAKSVDLLRTTKLPISEIASAVGFSDNSLYSRVFKQLMGISPASFRKS